MAIFRAKVSWAVVVAAAVSVAATARPVDVHAASTVPQSYELTGYSGHIGEWELTATLARTGTTRTYAGPLKMTHVGWCSQDGPEVKTGDVHLEQGWLTSSIEVKIRIDGVECVYKGRLSDAYTGIMSCPDRRPVPLTLWLR